ncbi:hypothetical protein TCAL_15909 [Tigriopus californicus]|uniref:CUB domain-containing protein n=1 Tax=Tigriopus californicus TaxID=6832 RepID=A0A553PF77_TIGCA|nr:uncharacterized protein LOC131880496 [Tigriopus californicus]XP_059083138.1 uncharacterized protein LOC131880496 [Tigriopus californicus]TRY76323.1 hypothetical protein TCAL_15909 [Tigriopus californicus]
MLILGASVLLLQVFATASATEAERYDTATNVTSRSGKALSIFQIIKFKHDPCPGDGTRQGICHSNAECVALGGKSSGSCANGYGVCCIVALTCGQTTSSNCSYLTQPTNPTGSNMVSVCQYTVCKCTPDVCRIRLDFTTFSIAGPQVGTTFDGAAPLNIGNAIGECSTDSFAMTLSEGHSPSPICGFNTGQHMIYEPSDMCDEATFILGAAAAGVRARNWDIKITQYKCGDEAVAGPPGCLQYFSTDVGRISSYNFPTNSATIGAQTTHLSRQAYSICIRRNEGFCAICYVPSIVPPAPTAADQASYGLDKGAAAVHDLDCRFDYLQIPNAEAFPLPVAMPGTPLTNMIGKQLFCGRIFNVDVAAALPASVCSTTAPFRLGFSTGGGEFTNMATPEKNELMGAPGGIVGFSLDYRQIPC